MVSFCGFFGAGMISSRSQFFLRVTVVKETSAQIGDQNRTDRQFLSFVK